MLILLKSLWAIATEKGIKQAWYELRENIMYDVVNGTDTARWLPLDDYTDNELDMTTAIRYQATHTCTIKDVLSVIPRMLRVPVADVTLLDLGSGKGKVLCEAYRHGLRDCIGIEFNSDLCAIAQSNFRAVNANVFDRVRVHQGDCILYLRDTAIADNTIVFMYNPFTGSTMTEVLAILFMRKFKGSKFIIAYVNPEQADEVEKLFTPLGSTVSSGGQITNFYH